MCNLSAEKSRLAVQTVCKLKKYIQLYDHEFYLTPPTVQNEINEPAEKKRRVPLTASDYENYTYVIPSARTINDYKQMQASKWKEILLVNHSQWIHIHDYIELHYYNLEIASMGNGHQ